MTTAFEASFAQALLDPERPIPRWVAVPNAAQATRHFAIHRNNVVAGLVKVLKGRFPVTERIVGEEFFAAMARAFVMERPPVTPLLSRYGNEFADFIAAFGPARELDYLADVARLEAARARAFHAADAAPLDASHFAALDTAAVGAVRIDFHPSVEIIRSRHPIVTIWAMNSGEKELAPIDHWRREDALVIRPYLDVEVHTLPSGGAAFLLALAAGRPMSEAVEVGLADHAEFDLSRNLAGLISSNVARNIVTSGLNK